MTGSVQPSIRFDDVLLADGMAWTLFGLAQKEGLLYTKKGEGFQGRSATERDRQAVLSLIVLFDRLIVHDFTPGSGTYRLPDLESEGIVEVVVASEPSTKPAPLESSWKPTTIDPRMPLPPQRRSDLALVQQFKPLIIDRLMSVREKFGILIARELGISRRTYYCELLDLATDYATGNTGSLKENLLEQRLPKEFLREIKTEFFDFQKHGEKVTPTNVALLVSLLAANELGAIQEISAARRLGVATRHYSRVPNTGSFVADPSQVPRSFGLVRSILHEEGHFFPAIESVAHALKLRKNPNLRAFREQLREFHVQLARGDRESLEKIRTEVRQAKRALERTAKWELGLRWLTYISLPAGIVEALLGGIPIAGTSLAVMSAVGTATITHASRRNRWVMFGM